MAALLLVLMVFLWAPLAQSQDCQCSDVGAVNSDCDSTTGQCSCKVGVGGLLCDSCLPGHTEFSPAGCRRQVCDCDPPSADCSTGEACQCRPRITGEGCNACSFGYRDLSNGCTPCPPCFDGVAAQFNMTLERYRQLLTQLNSTLEGLAEGGIGPALLTRVQEYRSVLEELLQRASNASDREQELTAQHTAFAEAGASISDYINEFLFNLTTAESAFADLQDRLVSSRRSYDNLQEGVAILEQIIRLELRALQDEVRRLSRELETQINRLVEVSVDVNIISREIESEANLLLDQVAQTLENATLALLRLQNTMTLQDLVRVSLMRVETNFVFFEGMSNFVREVLENATRDVPIAVTEATRALAAVLNITLDSLDLVSLRRDVAFLESEVLRVSDFFNESNSLLDDLRSSFTVLNRSAVEHLSRSRELNLEASGLLNRSQLALSLANESATEGNQIISEANELLSELQRRFEGVQNLSSGLEEVLRNIEMAEALSLMAKDETERVAMQVQDTASNVVTTVDILQRVSQILNETVEVAGQVRSDAGQILSTSESLNTSSAELADNVVVATSNIDELQQAVEDDREAIATVTCTANDTIIRAEDILRRISLVNTTISNLTVELNQTELLPPSRLREVMAVLRVLEAFANQNQEQVDSLTEQIAELQQSASVLRARYTVLRQHRDLLQEILGNVEQLDCREQFEDFS